MARLPGVWRKQQEVTRMTQVLVGLSKLDLTSKHLRVVESRLLPLGSLL